MANKNIKDVAAELEKSNKPQLINKGSGQVLSGSPAVINSLDNDALTQNRTNAQTQDNTIAITPNSESASVQNSDSAKPLEPERVSRGYKLREDLIISFKVIAAQEKRKLYEVMEEALELYLAQHKAPGK